MKSAFNSMMRHGNSGHSKFQIDTFILGSAVTPFGQFNQALMEMSTRITTLEDVGDFLLDTDNPPSLKRIISFRSSWNEFIRFYSVAKYLYDLLKIEEKTPVEIDALWEQEHRFYLGRRMMTEVAFLGSVSGDVLMAISQMTPDFISTALAICGNRQACIDAVVRRGDDEVDLTKIPTLTADEVIEALSHDNDLTSMLRVCDSTVANLSNLLESYSK